ncbi:uncharacterized protein LOC141732247 isoform X6 [Larus michahellis]|uniref:uncharacterized protein LOC141732247 isoform X6 n=1 Tax=Larus michahellis TaxID=119627 RepID=UPI003D9B632D
MGARRGRAAVGGGSRRSGSGGVRGKMASRWQRARGGPGGKRGPSAGPRPRNGREHAVKHLERVKCFSVVALLLCSDSAGPAERIRSAQRVRECQLAAFLRGRPFAVR